MLDHALSDCVANEYAPFRIGVQSPCSEGRILRFLCERRLDPCWERWLLRCACLCGWLRVNVTQDKADDQSAENEQEPYTHPQ